jgi:dephospho-CoA kinase
MFHKILLVYTSNEVQIKRLVQRDGITQEEAERILNAQLPIDEKRVYADFIIDNGGSMAETEEQVKALWEDLQTIQKDCSQKERGNHECK